MEGLGWESGALLGQGFQEKASRKHPWGCWGCSGPVPPFVGCLMQAQSIRGAAEDGGHGSCSFVP